MGEGERGLCDQQSLYKYFVIKESCAVLNSCITQYVIISVPFHAIYHHIFVPCPLCRTACLVFPNNITCALSICTSFVVLSSTLLTKGTYHRSQLVVPLKLQRACTALSVSLRQTLTQSKPLRGKDVMCRLATEAEGLFCRD
jgi:hypothetical protein